MQTVNALRSRGFAVAPSSDAVNCTEVISDAPFWFYRRRSVEGGGNIVEAVMNQAEMAKAHDGSFRLICAGDFDSEDVFPFSILVEPQFQLMSRLHEEIEHAEKFKNECTAQFIEAMGAVSNAAN